MDPRGPVIVDLPDEVPARPRRRVPAGFGIALLLAIILGLATIAGSRDRAIGGSAAPGPRAQLPVEGTCLRWDTDPVSQTVPVPGTVRIIGCDDLHQGQVLQAWRIGAQPSSSSIEAGCSRRDQSWSVSMMSTDWDGGSLAYSTTVLTSGVEGVDFLACVVIARGSDPPRALLSESSAFALNPTADATTQLRSARQCLDAGGLGVGCHQLHPAERIGTFAPGGSAGLRGPRRSCFDYAVAVVGSAGAFSGPDALTIREVRTGQGALIDLPRAFCDIVAPVGRALVGTVVGLGDAPLPLG
ncbi:MAG: hypothetical protein WKF57_08545 [Nakamurella sp.]